MSIDCSVFILLYRFGLAVQSGVSGPQGADSAQSLLWTLYFPEVLISTLMNSSLQVENDCGHATQSTNDGV